MDGGDVELLHVDEEGIGGNDLSDAVARAELKSPVTTIVGKVVSLSAELDWFQGDEQQDEGIDYYDSIKRVRA